MKKYIALTVIISISLFVVFSFQSKDSISSPTLSKDEITMIMHMREEEKLALDVYTFLNEKYDFMIFENISKSEQRHVGKMINLLEQYEISDFASKEKGVFVNAELQKLYNQLIAQGSISKIEALKVGATIEDLDLKDLSDYMNQTQNEEILNAFEILSCGSRNHMRAFVFQLENNTIEYQPQFITANSLDEIIQGNHEKCGMIYK